MLTTGESGFSDLLILIEALVLRFIHHTEGGRGREREKFKV